MIHWTADELSEMAAYDRQVDSEPAPHENVEKYLRKPNKRKKNPEVVRRYREKHKERLKVYHHQYYISRRDELIQMQRDYRAKKKAASRRQSENGNDETFLTK